MGTKELKNKLKKLNTCLSDESKEGYLTALNTLFVCIVVVIPYGIKVIKLENKILKEERNSFKPDTVKVIVKDTVFLTHKDTVVKRTWLDIIINK